MRPRLRWIILGAFAIGAAAIVVRQKPGPYDFLRSFHPEEKVETMHWNSGLVLTYRSIWLHGDPENIKAAVTRNWGSGIPAVYGADTHGLRFMIDGSEAIITFDHGARPWDRPSDAYIYVQEKPNWLVTELNAFKRWLHLP